MLLSSLCFAVPQTMNYQGYLTDSDGYPLDGTVTIVFSLYNVPSGGSSLWTETQTGVQVTDGIFSVNLGSVTPITPPFNTQYYLGITVGADAEMTPRQALTSVGYAFMADSADEASDLNCSGCVSASELDFTMGTGDITAVNAGTGLTGGGESGDVTLNANTSVLQHRVVSNCPSGSSIRIINSDGTVTCEPDDDSGGDITAVNPGTGLTGGGSSGDVTLYPDTTYLQRRVSSSCPSGQSIRVINSDGTVSCEIDTDTNTTYSAGTGLDLSGTQFYVLFGGSGSASTVAHSDHNHTGVYAPTSHNHDALYVNTSGDDMTGVLGMRGHSVSFKTTSGGTTRGYIKAEESTSEVTYHAQGVHSFEGGAAGTIAYFFGDITVVGDVIKEGGTFKIDHPLDPENKYLYHSFVESTDMKNIYDGVVNLNEQGESWVELPEWFEALNRDFRYQLTPIGGPAPHLYIAEEMSGNRFKIAGGNAGMKVSWQVTGIRQDAYADAHPMEVEVEKTFTERGFYLHPELFGQPEEKGIEWARNPERMQRMKEEQEKLAQSKP